MQASEEGDEDGVVWMTDTSAEAAKQRAQVRAWPLLLARQRRSWVVCEVWRASWVPPVWCVDGECAWQSASCVCMCAHACVLV